MYSLVDLILLKDRSLKRTDVEKILTATSDVIKEKIQEGSSIYWSGLCTFTWKKKAETLKQAKEWMEFPYKAEGPKVRCLPDEDIKGLVAKGGVVSLKKDEDGSIS